MESTTTDMAPAPRDEVYYLSTFCASLQNGSYLHPSNASFTRAADTASLVTQNEDPEGNSLLDFLFVPSNSTNETWQFNRTEVLIRLETMSDTGVVPVLAGIGIVLNILLSAVLKNDAQLRRTSYVIMQTLLFFEVLFLVSVLVFITFQESEFFQAELDAMSYVTSAMSVCQFLVHWTFLIMQKEVYRSVKGTWYPRKLQTGAWHCGNLSALMVGTLVFHLPFVPYMRILLHRLHPIFNPCSVPIRDLWEMSSTIGTTSDWYYVLYFFILYFALLYVIPFFLIGCRDKDIIDLLFFLKDKDKRKLHPQSIAAAHTALSVSVLSNVFLVSVSMKGIIIGFRIVNFFCPVFKGIHVFFYFVNAIGNVAVVARPSLNLAVFLTYTARYRHRLQAAGARRLAASRWRHRLRKPC